MKKILSSILISVIVLANFLAPISVGWGSDNKIEVKKSVVSAVGTLGVTVSSRDRSSSLRITGNFYSLELNKKDFNTAASKSIIHYYISSTNNFTNSEIKKEKLSANFLGIYNQDNNSSIASYNYSTDTKIISKFSNINGTIEDIEAGSVYYVKINITSTNPILNNLEGISGAITVGALSDYNQNNIPDGNLVPDSTPDLLPECGLIQGTIMGCVAQVIYGLIFVPSSYLFALSGNFFDYTFAYSVNSSSYQSAFVVQGWNLVRDFVNMFFIFVLLYIAFQTILGLGGAKTKEMIINVVIIGLLINFSLFATRVIIDASNILARVFYNSNTIKITEVTDASKDTSSTNKNGVIPLSEALVNKINPQSLIINAKEVNDISDKGGQIDSNISKNIKHGVTTWTFIIVTLLASVINIVGLTVFLSVGLIFIARVVGLWLAMILAPFAFFSYTVPSMQNLEMIGWKRWWPETLSLAFLAPVFIFFIYLILQFLEIGLGIVDANGKHGMAFIISIIIPFAFVMILLIKAKSIAVKMSGSVGQSITNGVAAIGGLALGGAAIGAAAIGKGAGRFISKTSAGETATQKYETAKNAMTVTGLHDPSLMRNLSKWQRTKGAIGSKIGLGKIYGRADVGAFNINTRERDDSITSGLGGSVGSLLNKSQNKTNITDKARRDVDSDMKNAGFENVQWGNMTPEQHTIVKENIKKQNYSKEKEDAERIYRNSPAGIASHLNIVGTGNKLKDLNPDQREEVNQLAKSMAVKKFEDNIRKAADGVNMFTRAFSQLNTGTMDVRNLSSIKSDPRASAFSKIPTSLISSITTGIRGGILKNSGLSHGTVKIEGKFMDDLKSVLKDSLSGLKIIIPETKSDATKTKVGLGGDK